MLCHKEKDLTYMWNDSYKYFPLSFKPKLYLTDFIVSKIRYTEKPK